VIWREKRWQMCRGSTASRWVMLFHHVIHGLTYGSYLTLAGELSPHTRSHSHSHTRTVPLSCHLCLANTDNLFAKRIKWIFYGFWIILIERLLLEEMRREKAVNVPSDSTVSRWVILIHHIMGHIGLHRWVCHPTQSLSLTLALSLSCQHRHSITTTASPTISPSNGPTISLSVSPTVSPSLSPSHSPVC